MGKYDPFTGVGGGGGGELDRKHPKVSPGSGIICEREPWTKSQRKSEKKI